ncbi:MAG: sigma-54 dependent transcriptional regulator [Acidobacteriota bacterium]|nr:sigma-54 dependent transcriptional regulator [Acidobacteriota bacterium]MDQ7087201.1 sigma-54 dependent transcriptional regulator [Acidobacteriota bacterium]
MSLILVVDDEAGIREVLRAALRSDGHRVLCASSAEKALEVFETEDIDLVITDLSMPGMDGLALLRRIREARPETPSMVITAYGSKETAIEAMRHGAVNYLEKPFNVEEMQLHVRRALGHARLSAENRRLRSRLQLEGRLIGSCGRTQELRDVVGRIAATESTVLITGESGSGKEVVARAIHQASPRREHPFIGINCGAIPASLLESELFGHVKGAFTGADRARRGLVEAAEGGTLFLDEIGDMPAQMQVKLLRVLQDRRIRRVGGSEEIPIDVRILAATHRDLDTLVREGRFREDLYYRINVIRVEVPPLRERAEDIPELVAAFLLRQGERLGRRDLAVEPAVIAAFSRYSWPGNVRELENVLERMVALSSGGELREDLLPVEIRGGSGLPVAGAGTMPEDFDLESYLDEQRRVFMQQALEQAGGVQTKAARRLGMTFRSFRYFAKKFGLTARPAGSSTREEAGLVGAGPAGKK